MSSEEGQIAGDRSLLAASTACACDNVTTGRALAATSCKSRRASRDAPDWHANLMERYASDEIGGSF